MIITFTNVIGAIRNAISSVITTNLKMWLGFETSETLGREEVVNGDFATDSDWTKENGWSIANGLATRTNVGNYTALQQNVLESGKVYQVTFTIDSVTSGEIFGIRLGTNYILSNKSTEETFTGVGVANATTLSIMGDPTFAGSISNISVKELTQITPDKSGNNNVGELFTGKAIEFDGSTSYVDLGNSISNTTYDATTKITIVGWFQIEQISDMLFSQGTNFYLFNDGNGDLKLQGGGNSTNFGSTPSGMNRIVTVLDGLNVRGYINGVEVANETIPTFTTDSNNLFLGKFFSNSFFLNGLIADFQVYNSAWTQDDVTYDYANPNKLAIDNPSTDLVVTNLKGYWALSEGDGKVAYDSSGEGNNGTINGAIYELAQPRIPQLGMMNWSKGSNLLINSNGFDASPYSSNDVTIVAGQEAPDGTATAFKIASTGSSSYVTLSGVAVNSNMRSIYARTVTGTGDIQLTSHSDNTNNTFTITPQWQRFSATSGVNVASNFYAVDFRGASTTLSEVVIWGAQIDDGTTLGTYRLTDGGATLNSTVIANPTIPTQDIFGNAVRDRLNSFNLDGSGYAVVADDTDLDFGTGDFSVEAWVKFEFENQGSGFNVIYCNGNEFNDSNTFSLSSNSSSEISFLVNNTSCNSTSTFSLNEWVHVVGTRIQGTNGVKLYINGNTTPEATATNNNTVTNSFDKTVGYDTHSSRYYNNIISDVRVYSQALTSDEVENNYNAGLSAHTND